MYCKLLVVGLAQGFCGGPERGAPAHRGDPKGAPLLMTILTHELQSSCCVGDEQGLMTTHMYHSP
jgi:hypothetical protein